MGGLFKPATPSYTPAPVQEPLPTPTIDEARKSRESSDEMLRRKSRASTILSEQTKEGLLAEAPKTATRKLLGG